MEKKRFQTRAAQYVPPPTEAERLELAAHAAFEDGDMEHWRELTKRAQSARRQARERAAGVGSAWG
jgi:hypothetical protein